MKKLVILVTPQNTAGQVNGCVGALRPLLRRGHRIIFVLEDAFSGTVANDGFEEVIYKVNRNIDQGLNPGEAMNRWLHEAKLIGDYSPVEKLKQMIACFLSEPYLEQITLIDGTIKGAIDTFKPDVIYHDSVFMYPSIYFSGIPWIRNISMTPLLTIFNEEVPPAFSGFPAKGNRKEAQEFNKLRRELFYSRKFNDYIEKLGYDRFPFNSICPESQAMTVYAYPNELNYGYIKKFGWFNLEMFNRCEAVDDLSKLCVPHSFINSNLGGQFSGKLIYLYLGYGSVDLDLMNRLVAVLGKTSHKYIVSKGPRHCEYSLPVNMWGDRYLAQLKIVPLVDLVITHGGNQTVTEAFAAGKPMLVMPMFGDQFDNAQRLHETGHGIRLDPYQFTEEQLLSAIDTLLSNDAVKQKLAKASKRIQATNRHEELADKIEDLFAYN